MITCAYFISILILTTASVNSWAQSRLLASEAVANIILGEGKTGGIEVTTGCEAEPTVPQILVKGGIQQQLEALARVTPSLTWTVSNNGVRVMIGKPSISSLMRVKLPELVVDGSGARAAGDDVLGQPAVQKALEASRLKLFAVSPGFSKLPSERRTISLGPASVADNLNYVAHTFKNSVWIYGVRECGQPIGSLKWMH